MALDVSSSVNAKEYELQARGLAGALSDRQVQDAILAEGGILATAFQWSGRGQQAMIAGWSLLDDRPRIEAFSARLAGGERAFFASRTALGDALAHAGDLLERAPLPCARRVVDVSGDGIDNVGSAPAEVYRRPAFARITVNGLVVTTAKASIEPDPVDYYRREVIHGPLAFLVTAATYADYREAMRRKLLREIMGPRWVSLTTSARVPSRHPNE